MEILKPFLENYILFSVALNLPTFSIQRFEPLGGNQNKIYLKPTNWIISFCQKQEQKINNLDKKQFAIPNIVERKCFC